MSENKWCKRAEEVSWVLRYIGVLEIPGTTASQVAGQIKATFGQ